MQKSIPLVSATILNLVENGSEVSHWFLTGFNDPEVNLEKETESAEELKLAAESLSFGGGGDSKEQALQGKYHYFWKIYQLRLVQISSDIFRFCFFFK